MSRDLLAEYFVDVDALKTSLGYGAGIADATLTRIANACIGHFEKLCRQSFVPVTGSRRFFGDGLAELSLDRAFVSISAITVNGDAIEHDHADMLGPDELAGGFDSDEWHRDPRLIFGDDHPDWSYWPCTTYRGVPNIVITGDWGCCVGTTEAPVPPPMVVEALLRMIGDNSAEPGDIDVRMAKRAAATPETNAGGRVVRRGVHGLGGITLDPFVETVARQHRAPSRIMGTL